MDWLIPIFGCLVALGVIWAVRDAIKGSRIHDERDLNAPQTEADREALRAMDQTRQ